MKKTLTALAVLALAVTLLAAVRTCSYPTLFNGSIAYNLTDTTLACTTATTNWSSTPLMALGWNSYGDSGAIYVVTQQWADGSGHFVKDVDTIQTCTLAVSESTRATARRYTVQISRELSVYGRWTYILGGDSTPCWIDSVRTTYDEVK